MGDIHFLGHFKEANKCFYSKKRCLPVYGLFVLEREIKHYELDFVL